MKRVQFDDKWTPVYFVLPQILIIAIFFLWPAFEAIRLSFLLEDPWGMSSEFVWFENYQDVFADPEYVETIVVTTLFSAAVTAISLFFGMLLAVKVDGMLHGGAGYKPLIVWAYAIAPAVGGLVARFLFSPAIGPFYEVLNAIGPNGWFEPTLDSTDAWIVMTFGSVLRQISVNFIFLLAGLQSIPRSVIEASKLDNPSGLGRFIGVTLPLLAPTIFFLTVINLSYAFFETFGVIDAVFPFGPPSGAQTMVYKVYVDGFKGADLGGSSAQSVILMLFVLALTVIQFRFIEKRVHYT